MRIYKYLGFYWIQFIDSYTKKKLGKMIYKSNNQYLYRDLKIINLNVRKSTVKDIYTNNRYFL